MTETTDAVDVDVSSRYSSLHLLGALFLGSGWGSVAWAGNLFGVFPIIPAGTFVSIPLRYQIAINAMMSFVVGGSMLVYEYMNPASLSDGGQS